MTLSRFVSVSPDARLIGIVALCVLALAARVVFPVFGPAVLLVVAGLSVAILADVFLLVSAGDLSLARRLPSRSEVGRPTEVAIEVRNAGRVRVLADIVDEVPIDLCEEDPHYLGVAVEPNGRSVLRYRVVPRLRGDRAFGPLAALVRSPLGFWRRRVLVGEGEVLRVHPDASRFLRPEALSPRQVLASLGVKPTRQRGEGMDFESLREYVPGDDPRRIDWRATARRGRMVSRLYQHERNHTVMIAVDASRLMGGLAGSGDRTKLDCAVDAALALAYAALYAGDRAGLMVFDREPRVHLEPRNRRADLGAFVDALSPIQSRLVEADYRMLVRTLLGRRQKRSLVVVLTDFAEADGASLVTPFGLLARRHGVLLVALRDKSFDALDPRHARAERGAQGLYRRIVLDDLLREREATFGRLRQLGLQTLDLGSDEITAPVLNRYLALRYS